MKRSSSASTPLLNCIESLHISGGFLDGLHVELSKGLNCFIGARGAGKTTILEFLRYGLDAFSKDTSNKNEEDRVAELVEHNLDGGCIRILIRTSDGNAYVVSRVSGEAPLVLTEDGKPTPLSINSLFRPHVYSQSDVEYIASHPDKQLELIDSFEHTALTEVAGKLRDRRNALRANAIQITDLREKVTALEDKLAHLPLVKEQLKKISSQSQSAGPDIQKANLAKALRQRESRALSEAAEALQRACQTSAAIYNPLFRAVSALDQEELIAGPNGQKLKEIALRMRANAKWLNGHLKQATDKLAEDESWLKEQLNELVLTHQQQEAGFRKLLEEHRQLQGPAQERARLENQHHDLLVLEQEKDGLDRNIATLRTERQGLLDDVSELQSQRYALRRSAVSRINNAVSPYIRVEVENLGDQREYAELLSGHVKGSGVNKQQVVQKLCGLSPADLVQLLQGGDTTALEKRAGLNKNQAEKAIAALSNPEFLFEIETVSLHDRPLIQLNVNGQYKDSIALSTGQKCTAVLPILLCVSEHPLLIDQPEDNLDNRFISEIVVEKLKESKIARQLVFATHNPNLVVLSDADRIFVLNSAGNASRVITQGSVDDCKSEILSLLEGGADAFQKRRERYGR